MLTKEQIELLFDKYMEVLEIEIKQLKCHPTEARHLLGRLGEFYCALQTDGTLALESNQRGYDVISGNGRRISVKTTAQETGFVSINKKTLELFEDLMIVQYTDEGFRTIFFGDKNEIVPNSRVWKETFEIDLSKARRLMNLN